MIKQKKIFINLNNMNKKYYSELGYDTQCSKKIEVDIMDLSKGSHTKINCCCDICGKEKELYYKMYFKVTKIDEQGLYYCSKCAKNKMKKTKLEKYGSASFNNNNKSKMTKLEKYGDENYNNMNKNKMTKMERYGDEFYLNKEKQQQTCIDRYGVDNIMKTDKWKDEYKKYCIKKYGVNSYVESDEFKIKRDKSFEKFENNQPFSDKNIRLKIKKTLQDKGFNVKTEDITEFKKYKNNVRRYTERNKKILLLNWDGYDYYDNEYIKENFNLKYLDNDYPSVDHKISMVFGFNNNIEPEIIGSLDNLCFTKRFINSKKNFKISDDFIKDFIKGDI